MGYLYLTIALFGGVAKGLCGKKISTSVQTFQDCLFVNAARMLFCVLIGFALVLLEWDFAALKLDAASVGVYLLSALGTTIFSTCWTYAYKQDAYLFLSVFTMLGSIITCFLSFVVYREPIGVNEWIGMGILFCAVAITSKYNKEIKGKTSWSGILLLIIGCLGCAVADFSQKVYMTSIGESATAFNFYTYAFGLIFLLALQGATAAKEKKFEVGESVSEKKQALVYFATSFFLFLNTSFKTLAAGILPSAQIYPVLQGANLILSGLSAHFLFKEKLNARSVVGASCAFIGLMIMNVL